MIARFYSGLITAVMATGGVLACATTTQAVPDGYEDCRAGGLVSFSISVRDSITNQPLPSQAELSWSAGMSSGTSIAQVPTAGVAASQELNGPYGRPGSFDVVVRAAGYKDWHPAVVIVREGTAHCSVQQPVRLAALLQPA
jgi:hypothetical protein